MPQVRRFHDLPTTLTQSGTTDTHVIDQAAVAAAAAENATKKASTAVKYPPGSIICAGCKKCEGILYGSPGEASYFRVGTTYQDTGMQTYLYCSDECYERTRWKEGTVPLRVYTSEVRYALPKYLRDFRPC